MAPTRPWHARISSLCRRRGSQGQIGLPVAALEFIKTLGTNGGGFFNANGAHPYATPTPLTERVGMLAIAAHPFAFASSAANNGQTMAGLSANTVLYNPHAEVSGVQSVACNVL